MHLPVTLLFHISYIQLELLVIQKLILPIYFPILSLLKQYLVTQLQLYQIIYANFHLFLIFRQIPVPKNLTIMKKIAQNLKICTKTFYLTVLIKIWLIYSKMINKILTFLYILFKTMWTLSWMHMLKVIKYIKFNFKK